MSTESQARHVRTVVTGLVGFAAALEQELLATRRAAEPGSADALGRGCRWSRTTPSSSTSRRSG